MCVCAITVSLLTIILAYVTINTGAGSTNFPGLMQCPPFTNVYWDLNIKDRAVHGGP